MPSRYLNAILIRHGQTEGNLSGIIQGQSNTPLTENGVASTLRKAEKIRDISFDAVFCSDLPRAIQTLRILRNAIPSLPEPLFSHELQEIDFGDLTGRLKTEIMPTILRHKSNPHLNYPNGESGAQFIARVRNFFLSLLVHHAGQTVLIVTHYGVMETAARQFAGTSVDDRVIIGVDEVWHMTFDNHSLATKKIL